MDANYPMRINKYLSSQNYCSRREADGLIKAGLVKINGRTAVLGNKVSEKDKVELSPSVKDRTSKLLGPEMNREKEYMVRVDKKINGFFLNKLSYGMDLGDFVTKPCQARQTGADEFSIILTEGKKHQIRRMCDALGFVVKDLQRIRIMNIGLKDLKPNQYREIKGKELEIFLSALGL